MRPPMVGTIVMVTQHGIDLAVKGVVYAPQSAVVDGTKPQHQQIVWKMADA